MPSTINNFEIKLKQLIPPRPQATRGKPFPLNGSEEWFIYPHGKNVYLYNFKDKYLSKEYREHAYPVGVSKLSPSGKFVASGDQCGNLRVWNVENLETKLEIRALGGKINDLEWSEDEKYIAICGEGRDQFANVIKVDGGASFGELTGPSKPCPSITLNSSTLLLASDDKSLTIYRASPTFKFVRTLRDHDNFVQVVKFRGDGKVFASAGADGKVFIYSVDDNYNLMNQIKAHDMGILAMEWIDNDTLLTGSSDKSLKIWRIPEGKLSHESEVSGDWNFEKQICGIKVIGRNVLVLRLDGSIEFRDKINLKLSDDTKLLAGIGHSKGIVDVISSEDDNFLYSVSYDGNLKKWKREREQGDEKEQEKEQEKEHEKEHGHGHNNSSQFQHQSPPLNFENEIIFSCKNVQKLKAENITISENKIIFENGEMIEFKDFIVEYENGRVLTADGNLEQVNISDKSQTIKRQKLPNLSSKIQLASFKEDFDILCVYTDDLTLKFYYNNELKDSIEVTSKITAMAFNPGCTYLATADDQRRIKIYKKQQDQEQGGINWIKESCQWCNHSARIDTLLWLDEEIILSAGIDGNILAWSLDSNKIGPIQSIKLAHSSPINKLTKFGNDEFVSVGSSDACIKIWTLADRR